MASGEGVGGVSHGAIDFRIATKSEKYCADNVKKANLILYSYAKTYFNAIIITARNLNSAYLRI